MSRSRILVAVCAAAALALSASAGAQTLTKISFATNWFAQAEHGGFYQALAEGIYKKHGLDADIRMGGPQVNGMQLLAAGALDLFMGYDIQNLSALEQGVPVITVAAVFQKDPVVIISADKKSDFQSVVQVMEASRLVGLTQITFTTQSSR